MCVRRLISVNRINLKCGKIATEARKVADLLQMMQQAGLPLTQGYTINLARDRQQPAMLLLSHRADPAIGGRTFSVSLEGEAFLAPGGEQVAEEVVEDQNGQIFFEDGASCVEGEAASLVYFTSVAREEVVVEEQHPTDQEEREATARRPPPGRARGRGDATVQCDLCGSRLPDTEAARDHMHARHSVLTHQAPFFRCDFCGLAVTDRVAHMKVAHYSPLAQVSRGQRLLR
jgi:hypothetical protein